MAHKTVPVRAIKIHTTRLLIVLGCSFHIAGIIFYSHPTPPLDMPADGQGHSLLWWQWALLQGGGWPSVTVFLSIKVLVLIFMSKSIHRALMSCTCVHFYTFLHSAYQSHWHPYIRVIRLATLRGDKTPLSYLIKSIFAPFIVPAFPPGLHARLNEPHEISFEKWEHSGERVDRVSHIRRQRLESRFKRPTSFQIIVFHIMGGENWVTPT